ncbi:hypothetical protein HMI46_08095 [Paenibacillus alvei]|uniref:Uncharacterized protein n=1 Tax=Paenibacillus alvei TaxID=44250 RepID=A0AAP7DI45_PAEAL|nr:hypothetical protein [Paenibacillus alvei]
MGTVDNADHRCRVRGGGGDELEDTESHGFADAHIQAYAKIFVAEK